MFTTLDFVIPNTILAFFDLSDAVDKLLTKLDSWFDALIVALPNIIMAVLVFILFFIVARMTSRLFGRVIKRMSNNESVNTLVSWLVYLTIVIFGIFASLNVLGLDKTVTSLLTGAGIIGLAVSFAFQNNASNFISGILIALRKHFDVGDWVKASGHYGQVQKVTVNYTLLLTENGQFITIPNRDMVEAPIINFSRYGIREIELHMNVSYKEDLQRLEDLVLTMMDTLDFKDDTRPKELYFKTLKDYAIDMEMTFWIKFTDHKDYEIACHKTIKALMKLFRENNIEVQFPSTHIRLEGSTPI